MKNLKEQPVSENNGNRMPMKRRNFFRLLGGGILIWFHPWDFIDVMALPEPQRRQLPKDFNAFLLVGEDGTVQGFTGKIEMGQGPITSLAQELAEELDVSMDNVKMIMGDTALTPWDMGTFGSMTTRIFGPPFRAAAAEARAVLLELAAEKLGAPVGQLAVSDGVVSVKSDPSKKVTYAELAKGKRIERFMDNKPDVKKSSEFQVIGKPHVHVDARLKVTGRAKYSGDFIFPGMLFARILRPPSHGASLDELDTSEAEKLDGVRVVKDGDLVAVLHEDRQRADEALAKVKATWTFNEIDVNDKTIFTYLLSKATEGQRIHEGGDIDAGKAQSKIVVESEFHDGYYAHAPMEPHTAVAWMEDGTMMVHGSTQTPFPAQSQIAATLDMAPEKVRVITPFVGGGFGGKSANGQIIEAVRLAKITGKPVMVAWTREDEFFNDTFRPASVVKITSGMDEKGKINLWDYSVYYAGSRGADTIYDVPNNRTTVYGQSRSTGRIHPFATGAWRAPGNSTNTFGRESQIDILAARAGMDPLEFRLQNLADEKMIAVLKAAAARFGWKPGKAPSGRGWGMACGTDAGTYVANIVEVKVDRKTGHVQVVRAVSAQDMGLCVNPEGATIQMEGCITMGLGYSLTEKIHFEGGKLLDTNFDTYQLPLFSAVPKIETVILDRPDDPSQGGGEPAIINMGAAIANAIFDATGARLYRMPMSPDQVLEGMKNKA
jgi:nicotinate dehydrogenase subunit B